MFECIRNRPVPVYTAFWKPVHRGVCFAVLTWDGEVSAVSQDAIQDSRWARAATVIDDWDEEFDRGKVRGCARGRRGGVLVVAPLRPGSGRTRPFGAVGSGSGLVKSSGTAGGGLLGSMPAWPL